MLASALQSGHHTGQQLVQAVISFSEEIKIRNHSLNVAVAGNGCVQALLWTESLENSVEKDTPLQRNLKETLAPALRRTYHGFTARVRVYLWQNSHKSSLDSEHRLVKTILRDVTQNRDGPILTGFYPRDSNNSVEIEVITEPCPIATSAIIVPRSSHSNSQISIDIAEPASCIILNFSRLATGNYHDNPQNCIHITPEWSTVVLLSRLIETFDTARQTLPLAFSPISASVAPANLFDSVIKYHFLQRWIREQGQDASNDATVQETCRILERYFDQPWPGADESQSRHSHEPSATSAYTPVSRNTPGTS